MKRLVLLLVWALLPISVDAGVRYEWYDAVTGGWCTEPTKDDTAAPPKHDTHREYTVMICDTIYHIVECDSLIGHISFDKQNIRDIEWIEQCDTVFWGREYRFVWIPKVQVWLDSLQWQKLLRILEEPMTWPKE